MLTLFVWGAGRGPSYGVNCGLFMSRFQPLPARWWGVGIVGSCGLVTIKRVMTSYFSCTGIFGGCNVSFYYGKSISLTSTYKGVKVSTSYLLRRLGRVGSRRSLALSFGD